MAEERIDMNDNEEENPSEEKKMVGDCREYGHILIILLVVLSLIVFIVYVALGGLNINTL